MNAMRFCLTSPRIIPHLLPEHCYHSREIHSSSPSYRGYYDVLGITPKATQAQVKAAYYKLSMQYHPDKNKGREDAGKRFREITLAYEVLGNHRLRKLYDKGLLHTAGGNFSSGPAAADMEDFEEGAKGKSHQPRAKTAPMSGKTPIYDFDEWSRAHYSDTFARREAAKYRWTRKVIIMMQIGYEAYERKANQSQVALFSLIGLFSFGFLFSLMKSKEDVTDRKGKPPDGKDS